MSSIHPLLGQACDRHRVPRSTITELGIDLESGSSMSLGEAIETIDELRRLVGLPPRWQPLVVSAAPASRRRRAVEELMQRGHTTAQIADQLGVSARTVTAERAHLRHAGSGVGAVVDGGICVCVVGRPSLLRDVVHDCVSAAGVGAAPAPGYRPGATVVVAVQPEARDLDVRPGARVVTCGPPPDSITMVTAVRRGLIAVLPVTPLPDDLITAVRAALVGQVSGSDLPQRLVDELFAKTTGNVDLSRRDHDVLAALRSGESIKQTARRLGISQKTVENLRRHLYQRLGARSAAEAIALADQADIGATAQDTVGD